VPPIDEKRFLTPFFRHWLKIEEIEDRVGELKAELNT